MLRNLGRLSQNLSGKSSGRSDHNMQAAEPLQHNVEPVYLTHKEIIEGRVLILLDHKKGSGPTSFNSLPIELVRQILVWSAVAPKWLPFSFTHPDNFSLSNSGSTLTLTGTGMKGNTSLTDKTEIIKDKSIK